MSVKLVLVVSDPDDSGTHWTNFRAIVEDVLSDWLDEDVDFVVELVEPECLN